MWTRFQIWLICRKARILSKHSSYDITAKVGEVPVGYYRNGMKLP